MPSTKPRAYSRCQRKGGCTTTVSAPTSSAISALRCSLPHASVPQTRCVTNRHGAWIDTIGMSCERDSAATAVVSALTSSRPTMTSTRS